jgi:endo-1,4-beta-D-glucanase Y
MTELSESALAWSYDVTDTGATDKNAAPSAIFSAISIAIGIFFAANIWKNYF